MSHYKRLLMATILSTLNGIVPAFSSQQLILQEHKEESRPLMPASFSTVPIMPMTPYDPDIKGIVKIIAEQGQITNFSLELKPGNITDTYGNNRHAEMSERKSTFDDTSVFESSLSQARGKRRFGFNGGGFNVSGSDGGKSSSSHARNELDIHRTQYGLERSLTEEPHFSREITQPGFILKVTCEPKRIDNPVLPQQVPYQSRELDHFDRLVGSRQEACVAQAPSQPKPSSELTSEDIKIQLKEMMKGF